MKEETYEPELFPPEPGCGVAGAVAVRKYTLSVIVTIYMSVAIYMISYRTNKIYLPGEGVSKALGIVIGILIS